MKILVVIPTLGFGGAERLLVTLLPKIKNNGVNIKVCTLNAPLDLVSELEKEGISVVNLGLKHRWSIFEALIKLYKEVKNFKPEIIWAHLYFGILYSRFISIFFSKLKVISVLHYSISSDSVKTGLWYSFRNWIFNKSKRFDFSTVAVSESVKKDYQEFFGWNDIEVVFNAIDLEKVNDAIKNMNDQSIRYKYNILCDEYMIVLPGRLHESKGHKFLINAIKTIKEQYHFEPKVIIAGEGPSRNEIIRLITELKLDNQFVLTGNLEQKELFCVMKASDMIVIPSIFEAFGIVAIEAMYVEKPLIVTNIDGLSEITTNQIDAVQVAVENSDVIADNIVKLIKDQKYANFLANNAKKTASKYDVSFIVKDWKNIFERVQK